MGKPPTRSFRRSNPPWEHMPGSPAAIAIGCTCSQVKNRYGKGEVQPGRLVFHCLPGCPLHGKHTHDRREWLAPEAEGDATLPKRAIRATVRAEGVTAELTRIAAELSAPERVLLFCLASGTDWSQAGVTQAAVRHMIVRSLVERPPAGNRLVLTDQGLAVLAALLARE
jgi:hypothetical protein